MEAITVPSWMNAKFVEKIFHESEKDDSIRVSDVSVNAATGKGDNYASDMYRVKVKYTRCRDGKQITDMRSIIFKVAPVGDFREEMVTKGGFFESEMSMMSDTLVRMHRLLGSGTPLCARTLLTHAQMPVFIAMEDLTPQGFHMTKTALLDLPHCLMLIRRLAKFHAASVALVEQDPESPKKYTTGIYHENRKETLGVFMRNCTKALARAVVRWPEPGPRYAEKIQKFSNVMFEKGIEAMVYKEQDFNVITHGDCWANNMLFKYDDQGNPIDHIFLDFQTSVYTAPAIDLHYFLASSTSAEVRFNNYELLIREYHTVLRSTMLELSCKTPVPSYEQLEKSMNERAYYGMNTAIVLLPFIVMDKSKVKSLDELMNEGENAEPSGYEEKSYYDIMLRLLPFYDKMGLFDI